MSSIKCAVSGSNYSVETIYARKGIEVKAILSPLGAGWVIVVGGKYIASCLSVQEALKGLHSGRFDKRIFRDR